MKAFKQYFRSQNIAATRARLGMSQTCLAVQLGISRSYLGMVETGKRNLPSNALIKLAAVELTTECRATATLIANRPVTDHGDQSNEMAVSLLACQEIKANYEAQQLEYKLITMEAKYRQLSENLTRIDQLINAAGPEQGGYVAGYMLHRYSIINKMQRCNFMAQVCIRNKISLKRATVSLLESQRSQLEKRG